MAPPNLETMKAILARIFISSKEDLLIITNLNSINEEAFDRCQLLIKK